MAHILQFSAELLVEIFSSLFLTDILRCKQTCRTFSQVVSSSVQLAYQIELQKAGMLDNPHCSLPLVDKLEKLRDRELAWATLDRTFVTTVQVPYPTSGLHDVTPGVFFLGREKVDEEFVTNGIQSVRLPSRDGEDVSTDWNQFDLGMKILEFRPAIEEQDMIVFVVMVPFEERREMNNVKIVLRQYSNLSRAPAAAINPEIFLCDMEDGGREPDVTIEIAGENLAVVIVFPEWNTHDFLYIINWKTGDQKRYPEDIPMAITNGGISFLSEDLLLHPSPESQSLVVFHIPPASWDVADAEPHILPYYFTLGLPTLGADFRYTGLSMRSNPVCTSHLNFPRYADPRRPFANDPHSSIIVFGVEITSTKDDSLTNLVAVVDRQALLDFMDIKDPGEGGIGKFRHQYRFSWELWGPSRTRWFKVDPFSTQFTMNCAGQRYVQLTSPETGSEDESHNTIHLFDFNPIHVKFMAWHGLRLLAQHHSVVLNVVGADADLTGKSSSMGNTLDTEGIFEGSLEGHLPYVELITNAGTDIDYDALFMDEERLIGVRTEGTYRLKSMDVIYFG